MDSNYACYGGSGAPYPPPGPADPNIPTAYAPGASQFRQSPSWQSMDSNKGRTEQSIPAAQPPKPWYGEPPSWDQAASGHGITAGSGPQMPPPVYQPSPGPGPSLPVGPESISAPSDAESYYGSNRWTWDGRQWRPSTHTGQQYYGTAGGQQQGGVGNDGKGTQWTGWNGEMWVHSGTEHSGSFGAGAPGGCNDGSSQMLPPYYHHPPSGSGQEPPAQQPLLPPRDIFAAAEPYGQIVAYHPAHPASSQPPPQSGASRRWGSEGPGDSKGFRAPSYQPASSSSQWNHGAGGTHGGPRDVGFPPAPSKLTGKRPRPVLNSYTADPRNRCVARFQAVEVSGEAAAQAHKGLAHRGIGSYDRPGSPLVSKAAVEHALAKLTFWVQALPKGIKPDLAQGASIVMAATTAPKSATTGPPAGPPAPSGSGGAGASQQVRQVPTSPWSQAAQDHSPIPGLAAASGALSQPLHNTAPMPSAAQKDSSCAPAPAALQTEDLSRGGGPTAAPGSPPADDSQMASVTPAAAPTNAIGMKYSGHAAVESDNASAGAADAPAGDIAAVTTLAGRAAFVVNTAGEGGGGAPSSSRHTLPLELPRPQAHEQPRPQLQPSDALGRPLSSNLRVRRQGLMMSLEKRLLAQGSAAASSSPTASPPSAPVG
ncbi:hypothetical protein VaNZ11_016237 [Volvox africanus]|uniref:DUF2510 domain-containing protein n=1 Tax=Volvox africanus TaxID=51714 RepID=A0ABQ5SNS5_9CHLO|nr:hypothetical protein VaNZ11_016237 [Volvox africanus]